MENQPLLHCSLHDRDTVHFFIASLNEYHTFINSWAAARRAAKAGRTVCIIRTALKHNFIQLVNAHSQNYLEGKFNPLESNALEESSMNQVRDSMARVTANNKIRSK
jgi:hypothetical protein